MLIILVMLTKKDVEEAYKSMQKFKSKGGKALIKYSQDGKDYLGILNTATNSISKLPDSNSYFDK